MAALPLSVFIIAKNEEDRIVHALNSVVGWADEVIVVDSGSDDGTVAISDKMGAKVMHHAWQGYGPQKRFAESQCRNAWLLNIDADEALSPELKREIEALFAQGEPPLAGYHIPICIVFPGDEKPRRFAPSNSPVRLYDHRRAGFADALVHDSVLLGPGEQAGRLKGCMYHRCFRSHRHAIDKINYYSSMQAEDMVAKGRIPGPLRLVAEPWVAFFKAYFLRRYALFGLPGFTESVMYAFARFIRLAKARELARDTSSNKR
ncbi:glycosyltransferase [bacterium]|nr:glycosyltransferase [bacterium]